MENKLNVFSSRAGFNTALRHFKSVTAFAAEVSEGENLANLINESLDEKEIERYQVKTILNALLLDKFNYASKSHNLERTVEEADHVIKAISQWGNINIVLSYHNPQAGLSVVNPKLQVSWEGILPLIRDELIVVYAGPASEEVNLETCTSAIDDFISLLYGNKVKTKPAYVGRRVEEVEEPKPQEAQVQAAVIARRVTPRYSIQVSNELFHNGNVEAWKKIVESFKAKYQGLDVLIWYENERINDINSLFKWGKVKHGGLIFFSVSGENILGVSKLQRYLFEGASPRFEVFLRGGIGRTLDLF